MSDPVNKKRGWIGVDLDGTLAVYDGWRADGGVGSPVPLMLARVKAWLSHDVEVRIMTARATIPEQIDIVQDWLESVGLPRLQVTCSKDLQMIELWDDRAISVEPNTGRILTALYHQIMPLPDEVFVTALVHPASSAHEG